MVSSVDRIAYFELVSYVLLLEESVKEHVFVILVCSYILYIQWPSIL